jgi:hypothetical protein
MFPRIRRSQIVYTRVCGRAEAATRCYSCSYVTNTTSTVHHPCDGLFGVSLTRLPLVTYEHARRRSMLEVKARPQRGRKQAIQA